MKISSAFCLLITVSLLSACYNRDIHSDSSWDNKMQQRTADIAFAKTNAKGIQLLDVSFTSGYISKISPTLDITKCTGFEKPVRLDTGSENPEVIATLYRGGSFERNPKKDCILEGIFRNTGKAIKFRLVWKKGARNFTVNAQGMTGELIQLKTWRNYPGDPGHYKHVPGKATKRMNY